MYIVRFHTKKYVTSNLSHSLSLPIPQHNTPPPLPYKMGLRENPNPTYTKPISFYSGDTAADPLHVRLKLTRCAM